MYLAVFLDFLTPIGVKFGNTARGWLTSSKSLKLSEFSCTLVKLEILIGNSHYQSSK